MESKSETRLIEYIDRITSPDCEAMSCAELRLDSRVKVPKSLGELERIAIKLAGITGKAYGNDVKDQAIILMCGDNGIVEEGVASAPQTVTLMQTINFTKKITGVGSQAKYFGIDLLPVDVGVKLPIEEEYLSDEMTFDNKVVNRRILSGTRSFMKEPAMKREEAIEAILVGIEATDYCKASGKTLIGVGEMGIGNTTTASAVIAGCLLGEGVIQVKDLDSVVDKIVGRGGGLNDEGLILKKKVVSKALKQHSEIFTDGFDPIALLHTLGGLDIAAMVGAYLGAAINRMPAVVDGVISMAAALLASMIEPKVKEYIFLSHKSEEGGYTLASEMLGLNPMYDLKMKLGEGSGCPIAFKIIEVATSVINYMWSLEEAQVDSSYLEKLKKEGQFK